MEREFSHIKHEYDPWHWNKVINNVIKAKTITFNFRIFVKPFGNLPN